MDSTRSRDSLAATGADCDDGTPAVLPLGQSSGSDAVREDHHGVDIWIEINEYLDWMAVHNYAATTVENRRRYLGYFESFAGSMGVERPGEVSYGLRPLVTKSPSMRIARR